MTDEDNWLQRYAELQREVGNPFVYWLSLTLAIAGVTGILWGLPVPAQFQDISPLLNWGSAFLMVTAIYYFIISLSLAIGLLPFLLLTAALQSWLLASPYPSRSIAIGLLAAGVVGLLLDRAGHLATVVKDVQLLMIGPAWLLSLVYRRFGIPI